MEDTRLTILLDLFIIKLVVVVIVDKKAVVGSSHGDMPKYVGEGVVLRRTPGALGVPLSHYSCLSMVF